MKKNIAIVSDVLMFWNIFLPLLTKTNQDVNIMICTSVLEIDEKLLTSTCDLILVDGGMIRMSSFDILQQIRIAKQIDAPIWFFPEIHTDAYLSKIKEMGATHIVTKPFDPYKVTNEISSLLLNKS